MTATAAAEVVRPNPPGKLRLLPGQAAPISGRVHVLTEIAARYSDLVDTLNGPDGVRGDGGSGLRMPRTYTATVREFERLVLQLRDTDRNLWWHLDGWWLSATTRTMYHCPRCGMTHQSEHVHGKKSGHGLMVVKCKPVVVYTRRSGVREGYAKQAIERIAEAWALGHEPMLPGCDKNTHAPDCKCRR